jgi:hypothetical protein
VSRATEIRVYLKVAFLALRGQVVKFVDNDEILKSEFAQ